MPALKPPRLPSDAALDDLEAYCLAHSAAWWGGEALSVPPELWPALRKLVSRADLWPAAKRRLCHAEDGAFGMLRALAYHAASCSPEANVAVSGFPVLAKGILAAPADFSADREGLADLSSVLALALDVRPRSVKVLPWLTEVRSLSALAPAGLRRASEDLWQHGKSDRLPAARPWGEWDERMLMLVVILRDPAVNEPPSRIAAAAVEQFVAARLAGGPLAVAVQPLQPLHRILMAADMFTAQKAMRAVIGPWPVTLVRTDAEWVLRSDTAERTLDLPGLPTEWLISAAQAKASSAGGALTFEDRRSATGG